MRRSILASVVALGLCPGLASAVEIMDFDLKDTQDLLDLCTTPRSDTVRTEAIHYCVAFLAGAVGYHNALSDHKQMTRLTCYPDGTSRVQGIQAFLAWARMHQGDAKLMGEAPVIGLMRSLSAKWPCK